MLDTRRLQIFRTVAEHGSFTAAAEALFMTHSAVSQQMALLERQLAVSLMVRGPRGVELTGAGRLLADRSAVVLGAIASVEQEIAELRSRQATVRICAFPTAASDLIPRVVRAFGERRPETNIALRSAPASHMHTLLRDGSVQLALTWDYDFMPRNTPSDIELHHLVDDPMYILVPTGHPFAGETSVELPDLAGETWVVRGHQAPYDEAFTTMCHSAGFEPQIAFATEDYHSAQGLVAAGIGICAAPRLALTPARRDVVVVPIAGRPPHRRIAAARLRNAAPSDAIEELLTILREVAASLPEDTETLR